MGTPVLSVLPSFRSESLRMGWVRRKHRAISMIDLGTRFRANLFFPFAEGVLDWRASRAIQSRLEGARIRAPSLPLLPGVPGRQMPESKRWA
jgi:hypothetical protein